jgi:hypothetical protein
MSEIEMKKIISFSLYGNKPNFQVGAVVNVLEAKRLYPDWKCRFYTTDDESICKQLEYLGAEIVRMDDWPEGQMFWRFLAIDDADICISRDADSVVNEREVGAVQEWLESDFQWHSMHDHKNHRKVSIMGGMWGCKQYGDFVPESIAQNDDAYIFDFRRKPMRKHIDEWIKTGGKTIGRNWDQRFLGYLYENKAQTNIMWHGGWANNPGRPFPNHVPCRYSNFVGDYSFWVGGWKGFVRQDNDVAPDAVYDRTLDRVIVSFDSHPNYKDFWPLCAAAWKRIEVKPTLIVVEKPEENIKVDESIGEVLRLKLKDSSIHTAFASQAVRLLAPCLYPEENVTIADIDIIPLNQDYFFKNLCRGSQDSFIEYRHGAAGGGQVPMCWNAASGNVWSEIFNVTATLDNYQDVFLRRLKEWSPKNYRPISEGRSSDWFTDQKTLYKYLKDWDGGKRHIKLKDYHTGYCRLDHRIKNVAKMHDCFTDFCPRRPIKHNLANRGRPDLNNIDSIKHVFEFYNIPWSYSE